jgi:hypothetical protein
MNKRLLNTALVLVSGSAKALAALKDAIMKALAPPSRSYPEAHCMRGPGPKWREKYGKVSSESR